MKLAFRGKNSQVLFYVMIALAVCALVWIFSGLKRALGPVGDLIGKVGGALTTGTDQLLGAVGLDDKANKIALNAIEGSGASNPWNPGFFQEEGIPDNYEGLTDAQMATYQDGIKDARSFFTGTSMTQLCNVFQKFDSQAQFSEFCSYWSNNMGTSLAGWLQSGALGLIYGEIKNTDFEELDGIIQNLPKYLTQ